MLALSTTLSMITPALALQEPKLPPKGASVFVDDVRVSAGEPATAKIHVKHDNIGVQTGKIMLDIPAATTGITTADPLIASHRGMSVKAGDTLKTTGVGNLIWRSPDEYFTETDIDLRVPNVSATTKIGLEVEQISGRAQGTDTNTKISLDKVNAVSGSFIVQYPVTVKIADDSEKPKGAAIKVKTTNYNSKATFDQAGQTETDVYNGGNGGTFYVDSGEGQQNAPVLEFAVPENYYAEVTVGNTKKNTVATSSFTLSEITAKTDVSVKLIAGKVPADTISTANITYKYGKYDLGTDTKQFDKKGTANSVAPKDFTAEGYTVYQYKLNENAVADIDATGTVNVNLTKDTNTVVFYYKRNDNSTVLPGPDNTMPSDDDIIVKPADGNADALAPDTDGAVTFPTDGKGGTVSDKKGNSMVVPGGTKVDEAGNIYLPDSTDPVKPGDPNTVPAGWYQITYKYENTKLFIQLGKENETVEALDWPSSVEKPAGKAFDGWNTMNSGVGGERVSVKDSISGPKTLYAQWKDDYGQNKITITFYPNLKKDETAADAATQVIGNSQDTTFIATLTPDKTFTKDGWTLAGWNEQQNGSGTTHKVNGQIRRELAAGNLSLYAMWTKTGDNSITVPGKDGIPGNTDDATANGSATQKPERKDDGTIDVPNGGSVTEGGKEYPMPNGGTLKPNGDIIIKQPDGSSIVVKPDGSTEVLKPNGDKDDTKTAFTVTYHSGEANVADKIVTAIGSAEVVSGEALFSYTGHKFAYWTKNTNEITAVGTSLDRKTELTAHWYKVGNNGEIIVKPNPDKDKETVVKPGTDGTGPDVDDKGDVIVPPGGEIEVKPVPDGGNGTITLPDGGKVNPDGNIEVPDGNGNTKLDPSTPASWPAGWFTVKYLANDKDAQGTMGEQLVKNSGTIMSCAFTNTGKTFVMWNTDDKGTGTAYLPEEPKNTITAPAAPAKSITLYAIWSIDNTNTPGDGSITVPGKDGVLGGAPCDDVTITPNGKGDKPSWKEDKSGVIVPNGGSVKYPDGSAITPPNGSIVKPDGTIVLPDGKTIDPVDPTKPIEGYVKITYLPNRYGSGTMPIQLVKNSESNTLLPVTFIAGAGKTFSGWNTDANGHGTAYAANATIQANTLTKDLELYAQWADAGAANTATVIFHANNGTDDKTEQTIGSASAPIKDALKANTFTLTGWTFKGWTTQQDGSGTFYKDKAVITLVKDKTQNLYAQWIKVGDDGAITVPGKDNKPEGGDDITVKPNPDAGENGKPGVDKDGNITIPGGGTVVTPDKEITLPDGGTLKQPDGTIVVPDKDGNGTITIDPTKPDVPEGMFTVTYKSGAAGQKESVVYALTGKTVKVAQNTFTYEGHVFGYWTNADSNKVKVGTGLTATTVLTANWYEKNDKGEITIPGNPDGSTVIKPDPTDPTNPDKKPKVDEDGNVVVPPGGEVEKKPDGGTITLPDGGVVTPDGAIKVPNKDGETVDPSNPGTLPTGYFQIVYDANGGKGEMEKQTGKTITVKANSFTHDTLTFAGWNAKQNGTGKNYASNTPVTAADADAKTKTLTLYAIWVKKGDNGSSGGGGGGGGSVTSYVITASAGNGGTISPNGNVSVVRGSDKVFTITAKDGYRISNVIVDGESVGAVSTYTFRNVTTKHTIAASFIKVSEIPGIGPGDTGVDKWLRTDEHNSYITGYGNGLFGPENSVTRAQIAQIFYRLLKDQNVTATVNFSDVKPDAWYAEAVNALGSLGIISGVGKGKFDPDRAITRAEFCAVAARFAKVNSSADCPFDDVNTRDWYYQAVATAASYGWVTGVSDGSFHPNNVISRAQAATIINRMLGAAADRDFVDSHVSNPYKDVSPSYWAYYQIIEASIPHNHSYNAENVEIWNGLK